MSESRFKVGDRAYFQPVVSRIDAKRQTSDDSAIPVMVMGVDFDRGKVLYDVALPDGEGGFYEVLPMRAVDSFFLVEHIDETNGGM